MRCLSAPSQPPPSPPRHCGPPLKPHMLVPETTRLLKPHSTPTQFTPTQHHPPTYQDGRAAKGMNADAGDATSMAAQATTTEVIFPIA